MGESAAIAPGPADAEPLGLDAGADGPGRTGPVAARGRDPFAVLASRDEPYTRRSSGARHPFGCRVPDAVPASMPGLDQADTRVGHIMKHTVRASSAVEC